MSTLTEHQEQLALISYLKMNNLFYFSVPNGGSRNLIEAKRLKDEGAIKGASDLVVMLDDKILFIELKKRKGGRLSKEQKEFLEKIQEYKYADGFVAFGYEDAISKIEENLR